MVQLRQADATAEAAGHGRMMAGNGDVSEVWPELRWEDWQDTAETLHLWTQIIGKIRLVLAPRVNHWWHVTLYLTCRGLTTSPMPYGNALIEIEFDFSVHQLRFQTSDSMVESIPLRPMSVAMFYKQVMRCMHKLGMPVEIWPVPDEIPDPVPFDQDERHAAYDADAANRFWRILLQSQRVMTTFRAPFLGKTSPVHYFWGAMDLAVTRFSGRVAPKHASVPYLADHVVQTAYSHEVSSCGFWPGGPAHPEAIFYSYAYPAPPGFAQASVRPSEAYFHPVLGEFILPYDAVRRADDPDQVLMAFLHDTYVAAADLAQWPRQAIEAASAAY